MKIQRASRWKQVNNNRAGIFLGAASGIFRANVAARTVIDLNRVLTVLWGRLTRPLSIQSDGNSKARAETQFNRLAIPRFHCGLAPRLFDELALLPKLRKSLSGFPSVGWQFQRQCSTYSCWSPSGWIPPYFSPWIPDESPMKEGGGGERDRVDARRQCVLFEPVVRGKKIENRYRLAKKW